MSQQTDEDQNDGKTLEQCRREIDQLDSELLRLLNGRAAIACEIAVLKLASGMAAYDPDREKQVLAKIAGQNQGPLDAQSVHAIFSSIIHETRRLGTKRMQELSGVAMEARVQGVQEV